MFTFVNPFWQIHVTTSRNTCTNFDKSIQQLLQREIHVSILIKPCNNFDKSNNKNIESVTTCSKTRQWSYLGRIRIVNRFRWTFCSWWTSWGCCTPRYLYISLFLSKIGYSSVIYQSISLFLAMIILFQRLEDTRDQGGLQGRTLSKSIKFPLCLSIFYLFKWSNIRDYFK